MRNYRLYLKDILDAIDSIESFVSGMDLAMFQADDKTSSAVMRKLEIIGEATKQVPDEIRKAHAAIPWKEMAGMRDRLIHFYFGIDYQLIWRAIKERLPQIKGEIDKIMQEEA
jgi:uncharacterized protein with HEPN domain